MLQGYVGVRTLYGGRGMSSPSNSTSDQNIQSEPGESCVKGTKNIYSHYTDSYIVILIAIKL